MKNTMIVLLLSLFSLACSQKKPKVLKTSFTKEALEQKLQQTSGAEITIKQILEKHKGKTLVIDFWAGWCRDCIQSLPKAMELHEKNPTVDFVYLSLERSKEGFDKSLVKHNMKDKENYWFSTGWKNAFNNYVDLNWIPRYMVIDKNASIALYYSTSPEDPAIQKTIDQLK